MNPIFREKLAASRASRSESPHSALLVLGLVLIIGALLGLVAFFDLWRLL
jgi:hypothetical protein